MREPKPVTHWRSWATLVGAAAVTALGAALRLQEPLSSPQIGAEDPYTHIVFAREHLANGGFEDSHHLAFALYPMGLHVLMGILHALGGVGWYEMALFLPVAFGALGVLGVFAVALRLAGLPAAVVAGSAVAVMPEHIFRTNLLFPTALDMAIFPMLLLAALEVGRGKWAWAWLLVLGGSVLLVTHPWAVPLLALPVVLMCAFLVLGASRQGITSAVKGTLAVGTVVGALVVAAFLFPVSEGVGSSFRSFTDRGAGTAMKLGVVAAGGVAAFLIARLATHPLPPVARSAARALLAVAAVLVVAVRLPADAPLHVNYPHMVGPVALVIASIGLLLAAARPTPLGLLGSAVVLALLPLTLIDIFDSWFLPHRTTVFLMPGFALLCGAVAEAVGHATRSAARRMPHAQLPAGIGAALISVVLAGTIVAAAPQPYGWYRHYDDESYEAFSWALDEMERDPNVIVLSGHWRPNAIMKALGDMDRVRYEPRFYEDPAWREAFIAEQASAGRRVLAVVDHYHEEEYDVAFASDHPKAGAWNRVAMLELQTRGDP